MINHQIWGTLFFKQTHMLIGFSCSCSGMSCNINWMRTEDPCIWILGWQQRKQRFLQSQESWVSWQQDFIRFQGFLAETFQHSFRFFSQVHQFFFWGVDSLSETVPPDAVSAQVRWAQGLSWSHGHRLFSLWNMLNPVVVYKLQSVKLYPLCSRKTQDFTVRTVFTGIGAAQKQ